MPNPPPEISPPETTRSPRTPDWPQVHGPDGPLSLALESEQLLPYLDRVLRAILGPDAPPPTSADSPKPPPLARVVIAVPKPPPPVARDIGPNHHLWNNHGTWFASYTIYPDPLTKERVRHSLKTKCVETARLRRDAILNRLRTEGVLAESRSPRSPAEAVTPNG